MKQVIEFAKAKNILSTKIAQNLSLNKQKALILQYMLRSFLQGNGELSVCNILSDLFSKNDFAYLHELKYIQDLLDDGLVVYGALNTINNSSLELLNSTISLSTYFLKFLEFGLNDEQADEQILAYNDHLEYLNDQFHRIDLYQNLAKNTMFDLGVGTIKEKIKIFEDKIAKKIALTNETLQVEKLLNQHELNEKEKLIFLALLKEEYTAESESIRELNSLISLISFDNYEKIKNRNLLQIDSKLIQSGLIDYEEMVSAFGGITRSYYINEDILELILNPNKNKKKQKNTLKNLVANQEIFELITPTTSLDDVVMNDTTRKLLNDLLKQVDKSVVVKLKQWGIKKNTKKIEAKILLFGPPGTGKTMTANSLAKSLKKSILSFDCSKILSKYVGESEQNVRRIFDTYNDICKKTRIEPILLLNEADQFLSSRMEIAGNGADKMHNQMQNIFLEQIEKFEGILVATTNFLESLDIAFSRRFDYKIEFKKPNFKQRLALWKKLLPKNAEFEENFDTKVLANYPLSGGQIVLVIKNTALKVAIKEKSIFTLNDFISTIQAETSSAFGEKNPMGFAN